MPRSCTTPRRGAAAAGRQRWNSATAIALAGVLLPACSDTGDLAPPEIRLGEDVCGVCGMAVSDGRYAAAVVLRHDARDQVILLDDLGELRQVALPEHDQIAIFVRDEQTEAWLDAAGAHYVKSRQIHTPMGFGVAALATPERAEARRAAVEGELLDFDDLRPAGAPR